MTWRQHPGEIARLDEPPCWDDAEEAARIRANEQAHRAQYLRSKALALVATLRASEPSEQVEAAYEWLLKEWR